jgi:hypothetical protein
MRQRPSGYRFGNHQQPISDAANLKQTTQGSRLFSWGKIGGYNRNQEMRTQHTIQNWSYQL